MEKLSSYKEFTIKEGIKPDSETFQYYFTVYKEDEKKAHFCVWIKDEVLKKAQEIEKARNNWFKWVVKKIDEGDFKNTVLKIVEDRIEEIDLDQLDEKIKFE